MRVYTLLICGVNVIPAVASGQLTFLRGTERYDSTYPTVEHCLPMIERVEFGTLPTDTVVWDTFPTRLRPVLNTRPRAVISAARECSKKFTVEALLAPDSIDINRMENAFVLLYKADRIQEAVAYAEGAIAKIPAQRDTIRNFRRIAFATRALRIAPIRFDAIRRLVDSLDMKKFWAERIQLYGAMREGALTLRDTAMVEELGKWLINIPDSLSDSILQSEQWKGGPTEKGVGLITYAALQFDEREILLEKLSQSTEVYHEHLLTLQKGARINPGLKRDEPAKPILAEYWFPMRPVAEWPVRGRVHYIKSLVKNTCNPCQYHMLRRIAQRLPEVAFTLFAGTKGHFGWEFGALPMEEEARVLDSIHRKVYGFPGTVVVHQGKFWRIPDPDRRVVDEPGPNQDQYPTVGPFAWQYVLDRNGRFVQTGRFAMDTEESLELMFRAILAQPYP